MKHKYYSIPLDFTDLFHNDTHVESSGRSHDRLLKKISSLKRSIDEHIELIIMTHMGEYKNNKDYGFVLWDREFENIQIDKFNTHTNPKQDMETKLNIALCKFEPRLKNIRAKILFMSKKKYKGKEIKYFVNITVKGKFANLIEQPYQKSFSFAMSSLY